MMRITGTVVPAATDLSSGLVIETGYEDYVVDMGNKTALRLLNEIAGTVRVVGAVVREKDGTRNLRVHEFEVLESGMGPLDTEFEDRLRA